MLENYCLFIDDERMPVEKEGIKWVIVRNYTEAMHAIKWLGFPRHIQFDHDLWEEKTGYDVAKALVEYDMQLETSLLAHPNFTFDVHSQNPVGKKNIEDYLKNYIRVVKERATEE